MKRNILFALQLFCSSFALSACAAGYPPAYSAEAIEARVIDAETKQPLEGAIITADWELRGGGLALGGSSYAGELMVMETVTDKNGRFYFPAWGPIRQSKGELHNRDPRLILFKSGYRYEILSNKSRFEAEDALEPVRRSQWNGKTIELKPFRGKMEEYAERVYDLGREIDNMLDLARSDKECNWKKVPRMLMALDSTASSLESQGVKLKAWRLGQHILRIDDIPVTERCGAPKEFLRSYSQ